MGREKQKEFCLYSERFIRKLYMTSQGLEQIAGTLPERTKYVSLPRIKQVYNRLNF